MLSIPRAFGFITTIIIWAAGATVGHRGVDIRGGVAGQITIFKKVMIKLRRSIFRFGIMNKRHSRRAASTTRRINERIKRVATIWRANAVGWGDGGSAR